MRFITYLYHTAPSIQSAMHREVSSVLLTIELSIPVSTTNSKKMLLRYKSCTFFPYSCRIMEVYLPKVFIIISRKNTFLQKLWTTALHLNLPRIKSQFYIISMMGLKWNSKTVEHCYGSNLNFDLLLSDMSFNAHQLTASTVGIQWTSHLTDTQMLKPKQVLRFSFLKKVGKLSMGRHTFLHFSQLQLKQISRASNQTPFQNLTLYHSRKVLRHK